MTGNEVKNIPIVFILGHGRSGTTLLSSLLNKHPNIAAPHEYDFILYLYPRFGKIKQFKKTDIKDFIEALFADPAFSIWLMNRDWLTENLAKAENADFQTMCKLLMCLTAPDKENIKLLVDKNPVYSLFPGKLMKLFPESKFVHIVRDPRDSVSGHIARLNMRNPFFVSRRWVGYNAVIERCKQRFPDRFITIQYEQMVRNTDETLKSLFSFLEVPYVNVKKNDLVPEGLLSLGKNKFAENIPVEKREEIFNKKAKSVHESLLAPVNTSNIEKWRKEMKPYDIAVTERITWKAAKKYGYLIEPGKDVKINLSLYKLFKSKLMYFAWQVYTKWRYNNFSYNKRYRTKFMRSL